MHSSWLILQFIVAAVTVSSVTAHVTNVAASDNVTADHAHETGDSATAQPAWICPEGRHPYRGQSGMTCVFLGSETVRYWDQEQKCLDVKAKPVFVEDRAKNDWLAGLASRDGESASGTHYWLILRKRRGYGQPYRWEHDQGGYISGEATAWYADEVYDESCVSLTGLGQLVADCSERKPIMCENKADCRPGWFGPYCSQQCHCAGEPCDTSSGSVECKWGCERGWFGPSCSKVKEHPEVKYFCINSPEEHVGTNVDIHIHTKGVQYRSIYAAWPNSTEKGAWCPGTQFSNNDWTYEHASIQFPVNESVREDIRQGLCVGEEVAPNKFEWTLVIQEYEGIQMDSDLQVVISCDFNNSETLQRSSQFGRSESQQSVEKVELLPESTVVNLEVIDPFTKEVITEAVVGSPAQLEITFQEGSLVTGVEPHHCVASTPDGHMSKHIIDSTGCSEFKSPVSPFARVEGSNNTVATVWFPLFAFEGHDSVQFKCNFHLCFETNEGECDPGCRHEDHHHYHNKRRRRQAPFPEGLRGHEMGWRSKVIRILPDIPVEIAGESDNKPVNHQENDRVHSNDNKDDNDHKIAAGDDKLKQQQQQQQQAPAPTATSPESDLYRLLSPLTCGFILLLLVALLFLSLASHSALRGSIEAVHRELVVSRSRDGVRPRGVYNPIADKDLVAV